MCVLSLKNWVEVQFSHGAILSSVTLFVSGCWFHVVAGLEHSGCDAEGYCTHKVHRNFGVLTS